MTLDTHCVRNLVRQRVGHVRCVRGNRRERFMRGDDRGEQVTRPFYRNSLQVHRDSIRVMVYSQYVNKGNNEPLKTMSEPSG